MGTGLYWRAAALALALMAPAGTRGEELLFLGAAGFDGMPLEGVSFEVIGEDGAGGSVMLRTDALGQAEYPLAGAETIARVRLADNRYQAVPAEQVSRAGDRQLMFRVFGSSVVGMSAEERAAFARQWGRVVLDGGAESPADSSEVSAAALIGLLEGYRREDASRVFAGDEATSPAMLTVRVLDAQGGGVEDARVYLLGYDAAARCVRPAGSARTDDRGLATLQAEPDLLHRAEVVTDDGRAGRTGLIVTRRARNHAFAPVVLRRPHESISGVVFDNGRPAPGVLVTMDSPAGRKPLGALTDEFGYFSLGPAEEGANRLVLSGTTAAGARVARFTWNAADGEAAIPLDLIAEPGRGAALREQ